VHERSGTCSFPVGAVLVVYSSILNDSKNKINCKEKSVFLSFYYTGIGFYCDVSVSKSENLAFWKRLQICNITGYKDGIVLPVLRIRIQ
jgi:hypothetical protein